MINYRLQQEDYMKKKLLLILMMITIFTTGCNKLSESEDFVQGQEKLEVINTMKR